VALGRFLDLFRKKREGAAATAMVLTSGEPELDVLSLITKQRGRGRKVVRASDPSDKRNIALLIDDKPVVIKALGAPYPQTELVSFVRASWWWPDAPDAVSAHSSRVLLHAPIHGSGPIDSNLLLTSVLVDALPDLPAVAVLWADTGVVVPPDRALELAEGASRARLPLPLWVSVRFGALPDGARLAFTTGLEALGAREIEIEVRSDHANQAIHTATTLFDLAHYLLVSGARVRAGETVGPSDDVSLKVRFETSRIPGRGEVMFLEERS